MTTQDPSPAPAPAPAPAPSTPTAGRRRATIPGKGRGLSVPETAALIVVLAALFIYFSIASPFFLNSENLVNILQNVSVVGIIACPATLLLISGQFDLSVGSGVGFAAMVMAVAALAPGTGGVDLPFAMNMTVPSAFIIAVVATLIMGVINGFLVTVVGINALITTLGTLAIFRGLTKVLGDGQTIRIELFGALGVLRFPEGGLPILGGHPAPGLHLRRLRRRFWVVLRYTVYGRSLFAIGASPSAARLAGIRTKRVVFIAFLLSAAVRRTGRSHPPVAGRRGLGQRRVSASSCRSSRPWSSAGPACRAGGAASAGRSSRSSSSASSPTASSSSTSRRSGSRSPVACSCSAP